MGKASQLALVKIRKSIKKANRRINGSYLKAIKSRKVFQREGLVCSYGSQKSYKRKAGKFLKERKSFLMTQEKKKVVIIQKR